jgi:hypothetical protein
MFKLTTQQLVPDASLSVKSVKESKSAKSSINEKHYPWKNKFLKKYKWLQYDEQTEIATCTHTSCTLYYTSLIVKANLM